MTKREILKNRLMMAEQNVLCYSLTQEMSAARPGYEKEWAAAKEEADTIREMIDELVPDDSGNESITVRGVIDRQYIGCGGKGCIPYVFFRVRDRDGNWMLLAAGCETGKELLSRYDNELLKRREEEKNDQAIFHVDESGLVDGWIWV